MSSRHRHLPAKTRGRIEVSRRRGIFQKRKRRAAEAARPGKPGKETLREARENPASAVNPRSRRPPVRLAQEVVVQVSRSVTDADERARSRVLHADPTHIVEAGRSEERRVGKECRSRW